MTEARIEAQGRNTADRAEALLQQEEHLRAGGAFANMREIAKELGVPEAALVDANRLRGTVTPLRKPDVAEGFGALLASLPAAQDILAITRNEACVSEQHGAYTKPSFYGAMGQVVGEIDLRLFTEKWAFGYSVSEEDGRGTRRSLQFFDSSGEAIHKIYATDRTDMERFDLVVRDFADRQTPPPQFSPLPADPPESPDGEVDLAGFLDDWRALQHSHDFFGLLKKYGVTRAQAMRLGVPEFTHAAPASSISTLLAGATDKGIPMMIFIGNRGCIQIFSGPIAKTVRHGPIHNASTPRFNLQLDEDLIANAWIVRKPSARGDVHSLELYDSDGFCFAQIFGERKPGTSERDDWRALITSMESE